MKSKPTLLITGGSGLLALNWAATMAGAWDVVLLLHRRSVSLSFAKTVLANLDDLQGLERKFRDIGPDLVVHTAGLTNVENCEADPDAAQHINVEVARNVALSCAKLHIKLVHISTDHLQDGTMSFAHEDEPARPVNVYAKTKAAGEIAVLRAAPDAIVARTNFYCWGPSYKASFADWIVTNLRNGQSVSLFSDVYYTPIYAPDLAILSHSLVNEECSGVFNLCGPERLSKLDFGHKVAASFGLDATLLENGLLSDRKELVKRPLEMSLSDKKLRRAVGVGAKTCSAALDLMVETESHPLIKELAKQ